MSNLICLIGNIGVGKSTVADIFKKYDYTELTFAGPVKEIGLILGFDYNDLYGSQEDKLQENKFWGVSGREFMQKFATNIMRNELTKHINMNMDGKTIWVRLCEKKILDLLRQNKKIIISDGRFLDEINMIKNLGGHIIQIKRDYNKYNNQHESESYISQIEPDIIINNNNTINDLEKEIYEIIKEYQ
jgi:dephospho-CoA kinase